jgi:dolichol-phosphate mannosyltransferase
MTSEYLSTAISIVFNYSLNNVLTFRDRRKRGIKWFTGLLSFAVACSIGVASNIGLAFYLFNQHSGWFISAMAGVLAGVVWNYTVSSFLTWRRDNQ